MFYTYQRINCQCYEDNDEYYFNCKTCIHLSFGYVLGMKSLMRLKFSSFHIKLSLIDSLLNHSNLYEVRLEDYWTGSKRALNSYAYDCDVRTLMQILNEKCINCRKKWFHLKVLQNTCIPMDIEIQRNLKITYLKPFLMNS